MGSLGFGSPSAPTMFSFTIKDWEMQFLFLRNWDARDSCAQCMFSVFFLAACLFIYFSSFFNFFMNVFINMEMCTQGNLVSFRKHSETHSAYLAGPSCKRIFSSQLLRDWFGWCFTWGKQTDVCVCVHSSVEHLDIIKMPPMLFGGWWMSVVLPREVRRDSHSTCVY